MSFKVISAEEAALHIHDDDNVGFGGFTAAGTPKVVLLQYLLFQCGVYS